MLFEINKLNERNAIEVAILQTFVMFTMNINKFDPPLSFNLILDTYKYTIFKIVLCYEIEKQIKIENRNTYKNIYK